MKKIALLFLLIVVCCLTVSATGRYCRQCQVDPQTLKISCGDTPSGASWGCTLLPICLEWGTCFHGGCTLSPRDVTATLKENPWVNSKALSDDTQRFSPTLHDIMEKSAIWVSGHLDSPMELSITGGMTLDIHSQPVRFISKRTGVNTWLFRVTEDNITYTVKITQQGWKIYQGVGVVSEGKF